MQLTDEVFRGEYLENVDKREGNTPPVKNDSDAEIGPQKLCGSEKESGGDRGRRET